MPVKVCSKNHCLSFLGPTELAGISWIVAILLHHPPNHGDRDTESKVIMVEVVIIRLLNN